MAAVPKPLIENPDTASCARSADDVLSEVLRTIRLSGSVQFCFMPAGAWQTDDKPAMAELGASGGTMPFHIVVEGRCWLKMDDQKLDLDAGDVVAFPHGTGHQLGAGESGDLVLPTRQLPPKPWRDIPVLRFGAGRQRVRLLCGYLECEAMSFQSLRQALPSLMHVRGKGADGQWLRATIAQMATEVDNPRSGGRSVLERLTELVFIELLRQEILKLQSDSTGWLAALTDPALGRCLSLVHEQPYRDWDVATLARECGLSRSTLMQRFETVLNTSPIRYVRDWRLCLAGIALSSSDKPIAQIAHEAGYGAEAAFNRAFARAHGMPPATWRQKARNAAA